MGDVSSTRLYLGNLPRNATKADVENHFASHGTGEITEIKLMNGFGFVEYKDAMDARDVVPDGSDFMGERLVVQFARGSNRPRDFGGHEPRAPPRPRRTVHRMTITGLPFETSWQDLKDFARQPGLDVVYSEVGRERDGSGTGKGFVEYETEADLAAAVEKLDGSEFKGATVGCVSDPQSEIPRMPPPRDRYRSRSPPGRRGGYGPPPMDDYYDRRGPPRGYSPRRDDHYRRRSPPPPRDYYDRRGDGYGRSPPPRARGPPLDDYPPPRRPYPTDDAYGAPPAPRRGGGGSGAGYDADPYANGHGREPREPREPYGRPASPPPRRDRGYGGDYERRPYW
ncbi:hypothetical protein AAFC00_005916 [Neodothiora populina]|uniref:RRM domain-containing protein n=1 Tax=Neodothiora populina TaxID=2781224 RepID=A0ABR3P6E4_9PEZI